MLRVDKTISAEVRAGPVLIVEDDEYVRALLKSLMHTLCFRETVGVSGYDEALRRLEYTPFSMAIVDLNLGERDGMSLISEIRSNPRASIQTMPVLVASTASSSSRILACVEAGADAFLCKPFSIMSLKRQLAVACEKADNRSAAQPRTPLRFDAPRLSSEFLELD